MDRRIGLAFLMCLPLCAVPSTWARADVEFSSRIDAYVPLHFAPGSARRDGSAPLIIALHGRGGRARTMLEAWKPVARNAGAILVAPQSFDPFDGGGYQWLEPEQAVKHVLHAIEFASRRFGIDEDSVVVTGFSQGGYLALTVGARFPDRFAGVIVIGAAGDPKSEARPSPEGYPRYSIAAGERDRVLGRARDTANRLREAGLAVEFTVYNGVAHDFPPDYADRFGQALEFVLRRPEGPARARKGRSRP